MFETATARAERLPQTPPAFIFLLPYNRTALSTVIRYRGLAWRQISQDDSKNTETRTPPHRLVPHFSGSDVLLIPAPSLANVAYFSRPVPRSLPYLVLPPLLRKSSPAWLPMVFQPSDFILAKSPTKVSWFSIDGARCQPSFRGLRGFACYQSCHVVQIISLAWIPTNSEQSGI